MCAVDSTKDPKNGCVKRLESHVFWGYCMAEEYERGIPIPAGYVVMYSLGYCTRWKTSGKSLKYATQLVYFLSIRG